ncbi:MAG: L-threonylcarbamoyladenylate synthase [Spirochaetes bacterium]|nr:L-threonylcarbamoyladenylate synthase [Spirochaetota bacterium]
MEILKPTDENISRAAEAIKAGRLVAMPTETVYGLGANAYDPIALARIFEAKRRPHFDPLIVHIADMATVSLLAQPPGSTARLLMAAFWPGPLTLVMPKKAIVPDIATSGLPTVAIRFPSHPVARALIERSTGAVAAPSANPFGYLSPTRAEHVAEQLGDRVDFILDGGRCEVGVESTVVDVSSGNPVILRTGGLTLERLREVVGDIELRDWSAGAPTSPGQLPHHYAPRSTLHLVPLGGLARAKPASGAAAIFFSNATRRNSGAAAGLFAVTRCLSPSGDTVEAAAALFDLLHEMDAFAYTEIWAERVPDEGIGRAVNDRLYKASMK